MPASDQLTETVTASQRVARLTALAALALATTGCAPTSESPGTTPATGPAPAGLIGSTWRVVDIDSHGIVAGEQSTLTFKSAEQINGSAGCNRYYAALEIGAETFKIGAGNSTRMACPAAALEQEAQFMSALQAARSYRVDGDELSLLDEAGATRLRLIQMRGSAPEAAPADAARFGAEAPLTVHVYQCSNGPSFALAPAGAGQLELRLPNGARVLNRKPADGAEEYADAEVAIRMTGDEVKLDAYGRQFDCLENPWQSVRASARARGAQFRAVGQEPGWTLEILADRIEFLGDYGAMRVVVPRPEPAIDAANGDTLFGAITDTHELWVRISAGPCKDEMSGEKFALKVRVEVDAKEFNGCGDAL